LLEDGSIIGIVKGSDYIPKKIPADLIESFQPGFQFESTVLQSEEPQPENIFVSEPDVDPIEETDDSDDIDNPDFEASEQQEQDDRHQEETQYKSSYKDSERTSFTETKLTSKQTSIKTTIQSIINATGYDIDIYAVIKNVETCFTHLKKQVGSLGKKGKYWKNSDEKYIISCLVLYSIVKSGYTHSFASHEGDNIGNFLRQLQTHKFFHKKDINGSIFLTNGWSEHFTVDFDTVQALHSSKNFDNIYRIMFENCNAVLQHLFGPIHLNSNFSIDALKLIPLGLNRNISTQIFVTVPEYIAGNIPTSAKKILFGTVYQDIIDNYKRNLADAVNKNESNTSKKVYGYILENIERLPFALNELYTDRKSVV
jgi:hypothetical protein